MINFEMRELRTILILVEEGCFAGAAKRLGVTQPAISAQIARLEQLFGFSLFKRSPEGANITPQGSELLPLIENIEGEYVGLQQLASYWKRADRKQVKILTDGSRLAQTMRAKASAPECRDQEVWQDLEPGVEWTRSLESFDADIVLTGSFLSCEDVPGVRTIPLMRQKGMTCAWNPSYFTISGSEFSFPTAVSSTVILPVEEMARGFRKFLKNWCEATYGRKLDEIIESATEANAVELCRQGLGVLLLPGNAEKRLDLTSQGLCVAYPFELLLPDAFVFGIRLRTNERSPGVLEAVRILQKKYSQAILGD